MDHYVLKHDDFDAETYLDGGSKKVMSTFSDRNRDIKPAAVHTKTSSAKMEKRPSCRDDGYNSLKAQGIGCNRKNLLVGAGKDQDAGGKQDGRAVRTTM